MESTYKGSDAGKFTWTAGKFYGDADLDKGRIEDKSGHPSLAVAVDARDFKDFFWVVQLQS